MKIGTVYQPGSEDVKGPVVAGVHLGRPGFQGYQCKECVLACSSEWERHAEVLQEPCLVSDVLRKRASPWDKGPEPPAVTPDRIRNDKEA